MIIEKMYTQKQLAELLGVKITTLETWRRENRGPHYIRMASNKGVRYTEAAVQQWLTENTVRTDR